MQFLGHLYDCLIAAGPRFFVAYRADVARLVPLAVPAVAAETQRAVLESLLAEARTCVQARLGPRCLDGRVLQLARSFRKILRSTDHATWTAGASWKMVMDSRKRWP